jgi:hypothetical protein
MIEHRIAVRAEILAIAVDRRGELDTAPDWCASRRTPVAANWRAYSASSSVSAAKTLNPAIRCGFASTCRRPEIAAIDRDRLDRARPARNARRRHKAAPAQPPVARRTGSSPGSTGRRRPGAGGGANAGLAVIGEIALQFDHILREGVAVALQPAAHRAATIWSEPGARPSPDRSDPGTERRAYRTARRHQRRMVGQHDAPRPDPDRLGRCRDMRDHHRGRGAGDTGHAVMLGHPIAAETEALCMPGKIGGVGERP